MRQIANLLLAIGVFALTFFVTSLVSDYALRVELAGVRLVSTIPGLVLAAAFGIMAYRGGPKG